jgi:hypothetical protein
MRTVDGIIRGDLRIDEACVSDAIVNGSITVAANGDLVFRGICNGRLVVEPGGRVKVEGIVNGGVHYLSPQPSPPSSVP